MSELSKWTDLRLLTEGEHLIRVVMITRLKYFEDDNMVIKVTCDEHEPRVL